MSSAHSLPDFFTTLFSGHAAGQLAFLFVAAMVAGLARGFSGFGGALIFVPLAGAATNPKIAAALLLVIDGVMTLGMLPDSFRRASRREVGTMAIGALVGVPLGASVLATANPLVLRWLISLVVLLLLAFLMSGWRYHGRPRTRLTIATGVTAGLFSGIAQLGGPPVVAYWLGGAVPAALVRSNLVLYFAVSSIISAVSYLVGGLLTAEVFGLALIAGPAYGLGLFCGSHLFGVADEVTFRRICFGLIAMAALLGLPLFDGLLP